MKIEIPGYTIEARGGPVRVYHGSTHYIPTQYSWCNADTPAIAALRQKFYGSPDTPETAFAMSQFLRDWTGYRDVKFPEDAGKEIEVRDRGHSDNDWRKGIFVGMTSDGKFAVEFPNLTRWDQARIRI